MKKTIITSGVTGLVQALAEGSLSSVEITRAFLERLEEIQPRFHPMTDVWNREALEMAEASDARRKKKKPLSPLDGLPVTFKENMDVKGYDSTLGVHANRNKPAQKDAVVVHQLRRAGCVFLGKTNVSQLLLYHESCNPVFGRTKNPFNPDRGPGGSSGGEAAAIAAYGSPAGLGTDIGGSVRVPAHFCGIVGLKPTVDRMSGQGAGTSLKGQEFIRGQVGPLARSVDDLEALMNVLDPVYAARMDPRVPPLPFGDSSRIDVSQCTVGFFFDDGIVTPSAALQRAVQRAVDALEEAGAKVVRFDPPQCKELIFTYFAGMTSDGGVTIEEQVKGGPVDPNLKVLRTMAKLPTLAKKAAAIGLTWNNDSILSGMLKSIGEKPVSSLWKLTLQARTLQEEIFRKWNEMGLDAVVCPPFATPALPHDASRDFTVGAALSMRYNLLNFPAGVVPVSRVRPEETVRSNPRGMLEKRAAGVDRSSEGLPVGVQVAAHPYREDMVLALMRAIESRVSGDAEFPRLDI